METESGTQPRALAPLRVSGLVVAKADLVRALQVYVPQLVDIAVIDGEHFVLELTITPPKNGRS